MSGQASPDEGKDEKGYPLPIADPAGGSEPVCPFGFTIDDDFDVTTPINPPYRCKPVLKDPSDGAGEEVDENEGKVKVAGVNGGGSKRLRPHSRTRTGRRTQRKSRRQSRCKCRRIVRRSIRRKKI